MKVGKVADVPQEYPKGPEDKSVKMRVLIGEKEGAPTFVMRHFVVEPGGATPYHTHPWEHEVFVLSGKGVVRTEGKEIPIEGGSYVYVPPDEVHNFQADPATPLEFLCIIPREKVCQV